MEPIKFCQSLNQALKSSRLEALSKSQKSFCIETNYSDYLIGLCIDC